MNSKITYLLIIVLKVQILYLNGTFNILNVDLTEIDLRNSNQILGKINVDKKLIFKKKTS